jgi:cyclophilin family peptidyl-prolyl cis-trans isomerase
MIAERSPSLLLRRAASILLGLVLGACSPRAVPSRLDGPGEPAPAAPGGWDFSAGLPLSISLSGPAPPEGEGAGASGADLDDGSAAMPASAAVEPSEQRSPAEGEGEDPAPPPAERLVAPPPSPAPAPIAVAEAPPPPRAPAAPELDGATVPLDGFDAAMARLQGLREEFRRLYSAMQTASPRQRGPLQAKARVLQLEVRRQMAQAEALFRPLAAVEPRPLPVEARIPAMLRICLELHRFDDVVRLGSGLLGRPIAERDSAELVGIARFAAEDFAGAIAVLEAAEKRDELGAKGSSYLEHARGCLELWKAESEVRRREQAADDLPRVLLRTARGPITIELFEDQAPGTVGNFVYLVEKGFYDGTRFHRVIPVFMVQGGDPNTLDGDPGNDGLGGPGYRIPCESHRPDARPHFAGSISMAHSGKDSGGSQFFITHLPVPHLNGEHTVFGRALEGLDVVLALEPGDRIEEAKVLRKRGHEYLPPPRQRSADSR